MARLWIGLVCVLVAVLVAAGAWVHFSTPPKIIIVTGTRNLAYYRFGEEYAKALRLMLKHIDVRVVATRGSVDNIALLQDAKPGLAAALASTPPVPCLKDPKTCAIRELTRLGTINEADAALLRDPKASVVALIQGGTIDAANGSGLESLGTVFYEPLWLFRRRSPENASPGGINGLRGKAVAIGPAGSGIHMLASELLRRHGITQGVSDLKSIDTEKAMEELSNGAIDAVFIVASWDAPNVQTLLHNPDVELEGYPQADAYADYYSYLHKVVLHRGTIDFGRDEPSGDVALIATKASLIVRKDLPLPIQYMLLSAARQIHGQRSVLQKTGEFPAAEATIPPLSTAAQQFYKLSLPYHVNRFLMAYLPLSIAEPITEQIDNVIAALFLIGTLSFLVPLVRLVPVLYNWMTQRPVFRLIFDVMALEAELDLAAPGRDHAETLALRLNGLEKRANTLLRRRLPASLAALPLILRQHISALHERLRRHADGGRG